MIARIPVLLLTLFLAAGAALQREPVSEYQERRRNMAEQIRGSVLVLQAAPETDLVRYRQEDNFFYFTGLEEAGGVMALDARSDPPVEYLFLPPRNPSQESWTGPRLGPGAEAARITGFANVLPIADLDRVLRQIAPDASSILRLDGAANRIAHLRQVKSESEIARIERAVEITLDAHSEAAAGIAPGVMEYEIEARIEYEFRRNGASGPAFPSIVGSGPFSTVLHYDRNSREMLAGDLVVIDIGAKFDGYSADVTRTYPVSGQFSPRQREIYQIVLEAQKAALAKVAPGVRMRDVHQAAFEVIQSKGYGRYFIHGTSHHLGLHVHDPGDTNRPLEVNMVITVEPGIYIPEEQLGVRIEDDVVVTPGGYRLLSGFPKEVEEIEALMQH